MRPTFALAALLSGCTQVHWVGEPDAPDGSGRPAGDDDAADDDAADDDSTDDILPPCLLPDHVDVPWPTGPLHFYVPAPDWAVAASLAEALWEQQRQGGIDVPMGPRQWAALGFAAGGGCAADGDTEHGAAWSGGPLGGPCFQLVAEVHGQTLCELFPSAWSCPTAPWSEPFDALTAEPFLAGAVASAWYLAALLPVLLADQESTAAALLLDGSADDHVVVAAAAIVAGPDPALVESLLRCEAGEGTSCAAATPDRIATLSFARAAAAALRGAEGTCYDERVGVDDTTRLADTLGALILGSDEGALRDAARLARGRGEDTVYSTAGPAVAAALVQALPMPLRCPAEQLPTRFGVSCPGGP